MYSARACMARAVSFVLVHASPERRLESQRTIIGVRRCLGATRLNARRHIAEVSTGLLYQCHQEAPVRFQEQVPAAVSTFAVFSRFSTQVFASAALPDWCSASASRERP